MVPLFANRASLKPLLSEVAARQKAVLESGRYILGPEVESFEREFATAMGTRHCVGVANGTDAIAIALRALGIGPGDEVVVPAFTFFATPEAVVNAGARPVFCDIDPATSCMTAKTAEVAIGPRTKALMPVHIFGNPAPMSELTALAESRGLVVIGDAAQAAGAVLEGQPAAAYGQAATFSFYPSKNLGAFGDAGAIVTDSDDLAESARLLRTHGSHGKVLHQEIGFNSRLDEIQAGALRVLLPYLEGWNKMRRRVATRYAEQGLGQLVSCQKETHEAASAYHLYVVRTSDRDALASGLKERGVETRPYYTTPMHRQPALRSFSMEESLPNSERLAAGGLALPMGPDLSDDQVATVVAAVREVIDAGSPLSPPMPAATSD
jgi:dTDP-3-amino-3,4,6-trideoxy-alpha-D-glucose transaminase